MNEFARTTLCVIPNHYCLSDNVRNRVGWQFNWFRTACWHEYCRMTVESSWYLQELYFGRRRLDVNHLHWFHCVNRFTWNNDCCRDVDEVEVGLRWGFHYRSVQQYYVRNCGNTLYTIEQLEEQEQLRHVLFLLSIQVMKSAHILPERLLGS